MASGTIASIIPRRARDFVQVSDQLRPLTQGPDMKTFSLALATLVGTVLLMPDSAAADEPGYRYRGASKYRHHAYRMPYHRPVRYYYRPRAAVAAAPYYGAYAAPAYSYAPAYAAPVTYGYQTVTVETHAVQQYTQPFYSAPVAYAPVAYGGCYPGYAWRSCCGC
jgi:hypothetical protein